MYAEVVLPINLDTTLTYGIPIEVQAMVQVGMRVEVALGKNKIYTGIVWSISQQKPPAYMVKPILSIIDEVPLVTENHRKYWTWLANYYACSIGEVMNAVLPNHMKLSSETIIGINLENADQDIPISNAAFALLERLRFVGELSIKEAGQIVGNQVKKVIAELTKYSCIYTYTEAKDKYKPKKENTICLSDDYDNEEALQALFTQLEKAPKQLHLLLAYLQLSAKGTTVVQAELLQNANANATQLKALVDKGVFIKEHLLVSRIEVKPTATYDKFVLSKAQQHALTEIHNAFAQEKIALFHGVTGSGKTNVHIALAKSFLEAGKQILYLLPEIALTAQVINKIYSEFGDAVHVYHSKYSNHERVETWEAVRSGKPMILVGARSAVLLPFDNLGLVIVDEEHDGTYKQNEPAPRYNGRDAALVLAKFNHAKIVLSSATPSAESIRNVQLKKYYYVQLTERFGYGKLPIIEIVNSKISPTEKTYSKVFTNHLVEEIKKTLQAKNQVILFQNRRGYAPYLYCADCGWHAHCRSCDVALNYHKATDKLHCHYCGVKQKVIKNCAKCNSAKLYFKNYGTEKIEEEVARVFPQVVVDRLDTDAIRTKNKYQRLLEQIEKKQTHILVGTQLVAKGLDFDHVQLVGVVHADSLFQSGDYKASERAFQLLTQVSGRAGRKQADAKVVIQAMDTSHDVLKYVAAHDYPNFIKFILEERQIWNYPPFCRLIKIVIKHLKKEKANEMAHLIALSIQPWKTMEVLGPSQPYVARIQNWYIEEILLKLPLDAALIADTKKKLKQLIGQIKQQSGNSGAQIFMDVDPQ